MCKLKSDYFLFKCLGRFTAEKTISDKLPDEETRLVEMWKHDTAKLKKVPCPISGIRKLLVSLCWGIFYSYAKEQI